MRYYIKVILEYFAFGLIIPISVIWKLHNGLSLSEAAATEALILLVTSIFEIPTGVVADRIGNKKALIIGGVLHALAITGLAFSGNLPMFAVTAVVSGIAWAFTSGADQAYIHDDFLKDTTNYKRFYANASVFDELATIVGMVTGGLLLSVFVGIDMRLLFIIAGVLLAIATLYALAFLPGSIRHAQGQTQINPLTSLKEAFGDSKKLILAFLAFAVIYESGRVLWQPHLKNLGLDLSQLGLVFACFKVASLAGSFVARMQHLGVKWIITIFTAMSLALLLFGTNILIISCAALAMFLFAENYFRVYMSAFLNRKIKRNRATLLSIGNVVTGAVGSLLILTMGFFGQNSVFIVLSILVALKIPGFIYIARMHNEVFMTKTPHCSSKKA